ncbi:FAD-dependent oxidoreductase [Bacillus sp. JCM 19041]|uniref:FAD-dependent oxidoreductase n=1 Tax=Bacillus sp. JCM 19041 TaxID=1460637 RepID=UPI0006D29379
MNKKDGQNYDVVIIGGGLSGLTAAALLTQKGMSVLVLEQHYFLGGCAHTFRRKNIYLIQQFMSLAVRKKVERLITCILN